MLVYYWLIMPFKAVDYRDVEQEEVDEEGASGAKIRWLITEEDGAERFIMRHFELVSGGHSPLHTHPWEHEVFILKGECKITCEGESKVLAEGGVVLVPEGVEHNFENVGDDVLEFLCSIPVVE